MIRQRWSSGDWKNRTLPALKNFKPSTCMPAPDGRTPLCPTLETNGYHRILRRPRRSRNRLPDSRCWMTSFTREDFPSLTWGISKRKKPSMSWRRCTSEFVAITWDQSPSLKRSWGPSMQQVQQNLSRDMTIAKGMKMSNKRKWRPFLHLGCLHNGGSTLWAPYHKVKDKWGSCSS